MNPLLLGALVAAFMLVGMLPMLGIIYLSRYRERRLGRRNPLSRNLLRSPGESLRSQIDDLRWDVASYLSISALPIPTMLGIYLASWVAKGVQPGLAVGVTLATGALAIQAGLALKLWAILQRLLRLRLGYDAEMAAGQELHALAHTGYRVFHDFPVEEREFNIDHVLVGPGGVFAIETKGRPKPRGRRGDAAWEVGYDGTALRFPGWTERKPLVQAEAAATWLSTWLSSAVGERVAVQPVVLLPGWYVRRTAGEGIPVLATGQLPAYFSDRRPDLDSVRVQRIAHQLEQRCRDVRPRAYRRD